VKVNEEQCRDQQSLRALEKGVAPMFHHKIVRDGAAFRDYVDGSAIDTSWQLHDIGAILKIAGLSELAIEEKMNELQATGTIEFELQNRCKTRPRLATGVSSSFP